VAGSPIRGSRVDVVIGPEASLQITGEIREQLGIVDHHNDHRRRHTRTLADGNTHRHEILTLDMSGGTPTTQRSS
jgi:hypothetical protein